MQKSTKKNLTFLVIVFVSLLIVIISLLLHANEIIDIYKLNNSDIYNAYKGTVECSVFLLVISSILLIVTMIITSFSNKTKLEYVRDYKDVVDPILAESLIDKRIGAKELIMTCVARLINKGNIEYIDNNKIKLLNYDNISNYERKIVDMIFNNIGEEISFK